MKTRIVNNVLPITAADGSYADEWHCYEFRTREDAEAFRADVAECYRIGMGGVRGYGKVKRRLRRYDLMVLIRRDLIAKELAELPVEPDR